MKKLVLILFVSVLFASLVNNVSAQGRPAGNGPESPKGGVVKLLVIDADNDAPIEYANVVLYSARDSSLISGGITNTQGLAVIKQIPFGMYYITVDFIGYNKQIKSGVKITPKQHIVDLGIIKLKQSVELLDNVTIAADRKHIEYKIDKKIVNVSQDITSAGGNAVDVLENTPSIQTDIEGNVMLRGSSSFTVLIDGKPTPLDGSEALQQIPASSIENIEIITNPSAKFDPDGVAGIINIVLKKEEQKGVNGNVNLSYGSFNSLNSDFIVNVRTGKFNFFVGGNYKDRTNLGSSENLTAVFMGDSARVNDINGDGKWAHGGYDARLGMDYFMSDKDVFTVSGEIGSRGFERTNNGDYDSYYSKNLDAPFTDDSALHSYYSHDGGSETTSDYFSSDINYQHKFNDTGHDIQAYLFFSQENKNELSGYKEFVTNSDFERDYDYAEEKERSVEDGKYSKMRAKVDYTFPFSENGKFEAGYQFRNRIGVSDYMYEIWNGTEYIEDVEQANDIDFNRQIHAAYSTYTNQLWTLDFMLGLRAEYTDRLFTSNIQNQDWEYSKLNAFPTLHVSKKLKHDVQLQASYTSRIRRPRSWFLDPFISKIDDENYRQGNPDLEPAYIDSYELNAQKRFGAHFIAVESFYKKTKNLFERITLFDENYPGVLFKTFDNVGQNESYGLEFMGNFNFTKWWNMNLTTDLYQYTLDTDVESNSDDNSILTYSARVNNTFKVKKTNTRFQLFGMYRGPSITSQGERGEFFMINAAVRQDFFNRKLSVMFGLDDVFGTMKYSNESDTDLFYSYSNFDANSPKWRITISYRLNDFQRRKEKNETEEVESGNDMM